ncbi:MAG: UvrD-helicase domain-containing protein [Magnetococcales bacterium]|nr:UvrD-helicase domain-containing protein [Magnetococcales bacterium]
MSHQLNDAKFRQEALDPSRSFIVQAPAGSGKTGLLTQRFLKLLALVKRPEEVVAITFTRKAAGEMRDRILHALTQAATTPEPEQDHEALTWQLAKEALAQDKKQQWQLLNHPARLRLQTIDGLCASLVQRMPILSQFGGPPPGMTEEPDRLFQQAARATLDELHDQSVISDSVAVLLDHLDNNLLRAEQLLANMLSRRDQWTRFTVGAGSFGRQQLEHALKHLTTSKIEAIDAAFPNTLKQQLIPLLRYAASNLHTSGNNALLASWLDATEWPKPIPEEITQWKNICTLLLTAKGEWRKTVNKTIGFPPKSAFKNAEEKQQAQEAIDEIKALLKSLQERDKLLEALNTLKDLPPVYYTEDQWLVLEALQTLLPRAMAQLKLIFQERGEADFAETSLRAVSALGRADQPTDLALWLDARIQHLLVDEFQDTSRLQFQLLKKLTAGWTHDDGRTLFLVGDPMQSVYRFREAEVGLFLQVCSHGINTIKPTFLQLTTNFRSDAGLVEWVNTTFEKVLPTKQDISEGAITFNRAAAFQKAQQNNPVTIQLKINGSREWEAECVLQSIQHLRQQDPDQTIAVLVRARSHLIALVNMLRQEGISFQAVEIDKLAHRSAIEDLLTLTRALLQPGDNLHWMAVLRAPWCGLSLHDLYALATAASHMPLFSLIRTPQKWPILSAEGLQRLQRIHHTVEQIWRDRRRQPLDQWVNNAWLALGGPDTITESAEFENIETYFQRLAQSQIAGDLEGFSSFMDRVENLYASPDPEADNRLQIMTIHKAKGLEFDTVILPGLGRQPPPDQKRLMIWSENPDAPPETRFLLAPVRRTDQRDDDQGTIYNFIDSFEKKKAHHEIGRLLYVAATRAKKALILVGNIRQNQSGLSPIPRSLLSHLWPAIGNQSTPLAEEPQADDKIVAEIQTRLLYRLPLYWQPTPPTPLPVDSRPQPPHDLEAAPPFEWAGQTIRQVGILTHRFLSLMAQQGVAKWPEKRIKGLTTTVKAHLRQAGVASDEIDAATTHTIHALLATLNDKKGQWILNPGDPNARAEYDLSGNMGGQMVRAIIDRTFVHDGIRWIIDYKTSLHSGSDIDAFLDEQQIRYRAQLERYGALFRLIQQQTGEHYPIQLGLFFPLLKKGWRSWIF